MPEVSDLLTKALFKSAATPPDNGGMIAALKNEPPQPDAMPFGVGGPAEPSGSPAGFLKGVVSEPFHLLKRLMDSSANAVPGLRREDYTDNPKAPQPNQPMYDAATETAFNLMGMGMPAAEKNAVGTMGGDLALMAHHGKLEQADRMLAKGQDRNIVRQLTGWERDELGKPRFEITNHRDRMMYPNASGPAGTIYHAPDLYRNYPQLQNIKMYSEVNPKFPSNTGMWDPYNNQITLSSKSVADARKSAMHEFEHVVSHIQDFSPGTSVEHAQDLIKNFPKYLEQQGVHETDPFQLYWKSLGERNARNAETRADLTEKGRMMSDPYSTMDRNGLIYALPPLGLKPEHAEMLKALRGQK